MTPDPKPTPPKLESPTKEPPHPMNPTPATNDTPQSERGAEAEAFATDVRQGVRAMLEGLEYAAQGMGPEIRLRAVASFAKMIRDTVLGWMGSFSLAERQDMLEEVAGVLIGAAVCRVCGCTNDNACVRPFGEAVETAEMRGRLESKHDRWLLAGIDGALIVHHCAWATPAQDLCTHCVGKTEGAAPAAPAST